MRRSSVLTLLLVFAPLAAMARPGDHTFALGEREFLLDGKPFQIISGEMHPARIPREYWRHRIRMAKAMGCNTVAAHVFWNYHERYWNIGPQTRLYCPAPWLNRGRNDVLVFDLHCNAPKPLRGVKTLE